MFDFYKFFFWEKRLWLPKYYVTLKQRFVAFKLKAHIGDGKPLWLP